jgi:hypothetical protein
MSRMVGVADKSTVTLRLVLKVIKSGLGKPNLIMQRGTASSMAHGPWPMPTPTSSLLAGAVLRGGQRAPSYPVCVPLKVLTLPSVESKLEFACASRRPWSDTAVPECHVCQEDGKPSKAPVQSHGTSVSTGSCWSEASPAARGMQLEIREEG